MWAHNEPLFSLIFIITARRKKKSTKDVSFYPREMGFKQTPLPSLHQQIKGTLIVCSHVLITDDAFVPYRTRTRAESTWSTLGTQLQSCNYLSGVVVKRCPVCSLLAFLCYQVLGNDKVIYGSCLFNSSNVVNVKGWKWDLRVGLMDSLIAHCLSRHVRCDVGWKKNLDLE